MVHDADAQQDWMCAHCGEAHFAPGQAADVTGAKLALAGPVDVSTERAGVPKQASRQSQRDFERNRKSRSDLDGKKRFRDGSLQTEAFLAAGVPLLALMAARWVDPAFGVPASSVLVAGAVGGATFARLAWRKGRIGAMGAAFLVLGLLLALVLTAVVAVRFLHML